MNAEVALLITLTPTLVASAAAYAVAHKLVSRKQLADAVSYAGMAVQAAEELYAVIPKSGVQKFDYAVAGVSAKTGVSRQEAELLVQAAVNGLRAQGYLGKAGV